MVSKVLVISLQSNCVLLIHMLLVFGKKDLSTRILLAKELVKLLKLPLMLLAVSIDHIVM
jgi:hypothetical protein